jgi:hypothetical protein
MRRSVSSADARVWITIAFDAEIVEAGLADRDDLGIGGEIHELADAHLAAVAPLVGMHARGAPEVRAGARDLAHRRESLQRGADGERMRDAVVAHSRHHSGKVGLELGKIEVAMGIDEHRVILPAQASADTRTGRRAVPRGAQVSDIGSCIPSASEEIDMKRNLIAATVAGAFALCGALAATAQDYRGDSYTYRLGRAPDWNLASADGVCRLHIWVDDRAIVQLRGDQIVVNTATGKRSYDQGSVCTQPLPFHRVDDFRVSADHARGQVIEVRSPERRNNFTGSMVIVDPQNGGDTYDLVVAWRNPDAAPAGPVASNDPFPYFDETRACQDRVRREFLSKNEGDAYLEFTGLSDREIMGADRERVSGQGFARNRDESRAITYECVLNDRTNRVLSASYDLRGRGRYSALN